MSLFHVIFCDNIELPKSKFLFDDWKFVCWIGITLLEFCSTFDYRSVRFGSNQTNSNVTYTCTKIALCTALTVMIRYALLFGGSLPKFHKRVVLTVVFQICFTTGEIEKEPVILLINFIEMMRDFIIV